MGVFGVWLLDVKAFVLAVFDMRLFGLRVVDVNQCLMCMCLM